MERHELDQRLSQISTQWTVLAKAHGDQPDAATAAQRALLQTYSGAVYRYLLGAVRDPDAAAELAQEFAVRFLRGDFRRANADRGPFRNYLKTALSHLATDYHNARRAAPSPLDTDAPSPAAAWTTVEDSDFFASCRDDLLDRTWKALDEAQPLYAAVLRLRIQGPDLTSAQMATELSTKLRKRITADLVRKSLQRAHDKFADLLIDVVAGSLETDERSVLDEELRELDLLKYCRSALTRRRRKEAPGD
jgi:RNA polymerase sigma-70 factor (ECF subfamily)